MIALLLLAASLGPENYQRANDFFQRRQFQQAEQALELAIHEDPGFVPSWTLRGKIAMAYGRFEIARAAFLRAAKLAPSSAYAQFMLGFFYYVDNNFSKAVPALDTASRLNPDDPRALLYLALSEDGLAHPDVAEKLYQRTIDLETKIGRPNAETHTAYGRLLFSLNRYEESAQQVTRVLQLDPNSRDGHYESGRLAFAEGNFAKAAQEGEKALTETGSGTLDRQIQFLLARAYLKLGNRELAKLHREAFEASPPTLRR